MELDSMILPMTRIIYKAMKQQQADYDAEVADWYENGDGASPQWEEFEDWSWNGERVTRTVNVGGKGYRFPHCIHGMSLWTDYDNICGGCEDRQPILRSARETAQNVVAEYRRRSDWLQSGRAYADSLPDGLYANLWEWATKPLMRWTS